MKRSLLRPAANSMSSFSSIVGITLVLTMLGVLFIFLLVTSSLSRHFKGQLTLQIMLQEGTAESEILRFKKELEGNSYASAVTYISADEAAHSMQEELGEEFIEFLGYNPLPASLDIQINPDQADASKLELVVADLEKSPLVREVVYQKGLLQVVNDNMARWSLGLFVIGVLFLVIAVVLIVNTIQLAIFSQRFLIRSMQLVGATNGFIQRPFLRRGLWYGFVSAVVALALIAGILFYFRVELADVIAILMDGGGYLILIASLIITGLVVSGLATAYAVRRYIFMPEQALY